jgi:hypothetical protein
MLEGIGEGDTARAYRYREVDGSIEARFDLYDDVQVERWFYDEEGRPVRLETQLGEREPRVTTCQYDARGRVVGRNGRRFEYVGDRTTPAWAGGAAVVEQGDTVYVTPTFDPYSLPESKHYVGDCADVFFFPCSPVFAPRRPGHARAPRLPSFAPTAATSADEAIQQRLGCPSEGEEGCTIESTETVAGPVEAAVRAVVVTIARGASGFESTHLVLHLEDGWWMGPQIGDGPFNGNQTSGTLLFRVTEPTLRPVMGPDDLGFVAQYETETSEELEDETHDMRESGLIVCVDLASSRARCARVPASVREDVDGEVTEATARLRIVGDGTIAVDETTGRHERIQGTGHIDDWFAWE